MSVHVGNYNITTMAVGSYNTKTAYVGSYLVFGDDAVYTYAITAVQVYYTKSESKLLANKSNYAYVTATLTTYKDGKFFKNDTVYPDVTAVGSDKIYFNDDSLIYWNYDKYKTSSVGQGSTTVTVNYNGYTGTGTVYYEGNYVSLTNSVINDFKIGGYSEPHTFPPTASSYDIYVKGTRTYTWNSGVKDRDEIIEGYNTSVNIQVRMPQISYTKGVRTYYEFKNLGDAPLEITAYAESTFSYWDSEYLMPDYNTDYDYVTFTLQPGQSYTTRSLEADGGEGISYSGSYSDREYFTINGKEYIITKLNTWEIYTASAPYGAYNFNFTESASWLSISGMTAIVDANSSLQRSITITVSDRNFTSAQKQYTLTQSGVEYNLEWDSDSSVTIPADMTTVIFYVISNKTDGSYVNLSTSNVSINNGATVKSVTNRSNRTKIEITVPVNTSTSYDKIYSMNVTQPGSTNMLIGTINQQKKTADTYVLENLEDSPKKVRFTSTSSTFKVKATNNGYAVALTSANITKTLGCTLDSITTGATPTGYNEIKVTYPRNMGELTMLMSVTVKLGDKTLMLTIEQEGGGIRPEPIDPVIPLEE